MAAKTRTKAQRTLRFVLGDQLTRRVSSLTDLDPEHDVVLMVEVRDEATYVRHHKQKIAFLFAAMRHFAAALTAEGITVAYVRLTDPENSGSFTGELERAVARHRPARVVVTEPGEWRVWEMMQGWRDGLPMPVEIPPTTASCARGRTSPPGPRAGTTFGWKPSTGACGVGRDC